MHLERITLLCMISDWAIASVTCSSYGSNEEKLPDRAYEDTWKILSLDMETDG